MGELSTNEEISEVWNYTTHQIISFVIDDQIDEEALKQIYDRIDDDEEEDGRPDLAMQRRLNSSTNLAKACKHNKLFCNSAGVAVNKSLNNVKQQLGSNSGSNTKVLAASKQVAHSS